MKERYNALFDKLAPIRSDDELLRAVLDGKAEKMKNSKHFVKKAIIIPAAAISLALCTTAGVSAAYAWDIRAALGSLFNKSPETNNGESNFEFNDFDFEEFGGMALDQRIDRDGYTVQMRGVVADMHTALIFYDVIPEKGHVFTSTRENGDTVNYTYTDGDEIYVTIWRDTDNFYDQVNEYYEQNRKPDGTFDTDKIDPEKIDSLYNNTMLGKDGDTIHCALRHDLKTLSFKNREIVYNVLGLQAEYYCEDFSQEISEHNYKDNVVINFDFVKENDELTLEGSAPFSLSSGEYGAVTYVHMTSLSLDLDIEWEKGPSIIPDEDFGGDLDKAREHGQKAMDEINKAYPEIKVRFKDGTVAENGALTWDNERAGGVPDESQTRITEQNLSLNWKYPVKVADIDAVIIGDGEFKIN